MVCSLPCWIPLYKLFNFFDGTPVEAENVTCLDNQSIWSIDWWQNEVEPKEINN